MAKPTNTTLGTRRGVTPPSVPVRIPVRRPYVDPEALMFLVYPVGSYRRQRTIERPPEAVLAALSVLLNTESRYIGIAITTLIDHLDNEDGDPDEEENGDDELECHDEGGQCEDEGATHDDVLPGSAAFTRVVACRVAP